MDSAALQPFLDWLSLHPGSAAVAVFLVACSESLAVVGLFVPGVVLMFGIGALVAAGALDLGSTLAWATAGAIFGDGVSYLLGRHYHERLRGMWPFRKRRGWLQQGEAFFHRHGGKSILLGRFVGPVRPLIPMVAGMLDMPPRRFFLVNVGSALLWAPAYILPGVIFGASLGLASEVASRLALLLALLVATLWLTTWAVRTLFRLLQPRAEELVSRALAWSDRHPLLGHLSAALVDPRHPESRALLVLALILVGAGWGFTAILQGVGHGVPLWALDTRVHQITQGLRTPWADQLMVLITEWGDSVVLLALLAVVSLWLIWRRHWHALAHWLAAGAFGWSATALLKGLLAVPRPPNTLLIDSFSFPSGHVTHATVVFGFLAILMARELSAPRRWLPYVIAGTLVVLIGLSRLYLGAHWLSDVLGGLTLGLSWVALLGIAYRRHPSPPISLRSLTLVATVAFGITAAWHSGQRHAEDLSLYAPVRPTQQVASDRWWRGEASGIPRLRVDLEGEPSSPLTLQWAGPLPAIEQRLAAHGWRTPPPVALPSLLRWLTPEPEIDALPVLPQVHDGRHGVLLMTRPVDRSRRAVLRLWPSDTLLRPEGWPLWVGNVSYQSLYQEIPLLRFARTDEDFVTPLRALADALGESHWLPPERGAHGTELPPVLLLRPPAMPAITAP